MTNKYNSNKNPISSEWSFFDSSSIQKKGIVTALSSKDFWELDSGLDFLYKVDSFEELKDLADAGDKIAQYTIGLCYEEGIGTIKCPKLAFHYYELSAKQDSPNGLYYLARCYENGLGCKKSTEQAIHFYELASENKPVSSWSALANLYEKDIGCQESINKANFYHQKKFQYLINDDLDCPFVQVLIGHYYKEGRGVEKSLEKAFYYYSLAANQGHIYGYSKVAECYENGWGVEKSIESAMYYYELVTRKTDISTDKISCGLAYKSIIHLLWENRIDDQKLFFYVKRGLDEEFINNSIFYYVDILGKCFLEGIGCEKSIEKAIQVYELASKNNPEPSWYELANIYERIGSEESLNKASYYYQKRFEFLMNECDLDSSYIQFIIGRCYQMGRGTEKSMEKAFYYYNLAANQGYICAGIFLGRFYENGWAVEKSLEKALYYYELAIKENDYDAYIYAINLLWENRIDDQKLFFYLKTVIDEGLIGNSKDGSLEYYTRLLADCFKEGIGCEKSLLQAMSYYRLAVNPKKLFKH